MKKVKKLLACALVVATIFSLSVPSLAAKAAEKTYDYIGSDEIILATSNDVQQRTSRSEPEIVITYIEDEDRNHQIFTYRNGELIEIVYGGINATEIRSQTIVNGEVISESTMVIEVEEIVAPSLYAYKKQGTIEYENVWTNSTLSIALYLDAYSVTKEATIKTGVYTFAQVASWLLSAWLLPSLSSAKAIAEVIFGNAIISAGLEVIGTKTVKGYVSEYTWKGVPSDTSRGSTAYLDGMKVEYEDKNGKAKTYTEGYQANAFSSHNLTFGRWMMYKVYSIDEHPTTWA